MKTLPVEIVQRVVAFHVAAYVHEMVGPHAELTEDEEESGDEAVKRVVARPVVPLLLTSYQFRQITLEMLSIYFGIPLSASRDRLQASPWHRLAAVRGFVLTGSPMATVPAELMPISQSSVTLGAYILAQAALLELERVPCAYDISTLTLDLSLFDLARSSSQEALRYIEDAFRKLVLAPPTLQPLLRQHAIDVFCKVLLVCRYGVPLAMLVQTFSALLQCQAFDAKHAQGFPVSLPLILPDFLASLRIAHVRDAQVLSMFRMRSRETALDTSVISDLCAILQRIIDIDIPEFEIYEECKAAARNLRSEIEALLPVIQR
ncbi:hypothetical protein PsYK624_118330 [Phanerochaete sordida]|uniref:Uncharacterized protein n=1 Tax=Phanerochaete sordida TaxID=48140 RepID=A0A9P3GHD3_9APHY|nr:hypothetical protein PsYK624_118330 [Phanerochaete sordida]